MQPPIRLPNLPLSPISQFAFHSPNLHSYGRVANWHGTVLLGLKHTSHLCQGWEKIMILRSNIKIKIKDKDQDHDLDHFMILLKI